MMELSPKPFINVKYLYPHSGPRKSNTYAEKSLKEKQTQKGQAFDYKFEYSHDKENLDLMFANIDDTTQTIDSILTRINSESGEFGKIDSWSEFLELLSKYGEKGNSQRDNDITVQSWRRFSRLVKKSIKDNPLFGQVSERYREVRIANKIAEIKTNEVFVIDIAKLNTDMQAFVFGSTIKEIYDFQLSDNDQENSDRPNKIIVFIDELNKFASSEVPKNSPILRQILDISERGRSLGVILFGAEQFRSAIHPRVTGNSSTAAYGRTNAIELAKKDYSFIPPVYKTMMTRLNQGEYIIQNPIFKSLLNIKFPKPVYKQFK
jgi:uncharacterized protein